MRKKRANASERSAVERRTKKKRVLDEHRQNPHPASDEHLPDSEEELVNSQNPSRRDIDEP
ncbi:hypothetical protein [Mesorhizobium sp. WSM3224]|uniref:hypothetical protein n=1 Tax=Mesorhizobium sp. WSM3224 TaxID=1040986 RepID=UPI000420837E|nr:hypothetical protein [Mesorhizobium sp. WSM3224]